MHISCKAPLPHIQAEVQEGGGLHYVKYKSPWAPYWDNYPCIIPVAHYRDSKELCYHYICICTLYIHVEQRALLRDQPIMLLFLPIMLCCSALKIHLLCSRTKIFGRLCCSLCKILHEQFTTCSRQFYKDCFIRVF